MKNEQKYVEFMREWIVMWSNNSPTNKQAMLRLLGTRQECWKCGVESQVSAAFQDGPDGKIWLKCPGCGTPWWSAVKKT